MKKLLIFLLAALPFVSKAQDITGSEYRVWRQMSIGKLGSSPATRSDLWLEIGRENTNRGFGIPRTETNLITSPQKGNMIYSLTRRCVYVYNGTSWDELLSTTNQNGLTQATFDPNTGIFRLTRGSSVSAITVPLGTQNDYQSSSINTGLGIIIFTKNNGQKDTIQLPGGVSGYTASNLSGAGVGLYKDLFGGATFRFKKLVNKGFVVFSDLTDSVGASVDTSGLKGTFWAKRLNYGTNPLYDAFGTGDAQPVLWRVNGIMAARITATTNPASVGGSTSFGQYADSAAGLANNLNTAIGFGSLRYAANSGENTATGLWAGYYHKYGDPTGHGRNCFYGESSGYRTDSAGYNSFYGTFSGELNNRGKSNTGVGQDALRSNTDGSENAAVGLFSLLRNTSGISSCVVNVGGTGYTNGDTVIFSSPLPGSPGGYVRQARGKLIVSGGVCIRVDMIDHGAGYSTWTRTFEFGIYIGATATVVGTGTGASITPVVTSGQQNVAYGPASLWNVELGRTNTAVGYKGGDGLKDGSYNTIFGSNSTVPSDINNALVVTDGQGRRKIYMDSATYNIALGDSAMQSNAYRNGSIGNIGIGARSLKSITASGANIAIGIDAMAFRTGEFSNVALGTSSMMYNNNFNNTSVGTRSMQLNVAGTYEAVFGYEALKRDTSSSGANSVFGASAMINSYNSYNNSAFGFGALANMLNGQGNVALGTLSMGKGGLIVGGTPTGVGNYNQGLGYESLYSLTSGSYNVGAGYQAGRNHTSGSYTVYLGGFIGTATATFSRHMFFSDGEGTVRLWIDSIGKVGIGGGTAPHTSAMLDVSSTTKGFLMPRMNTTQQNAIGSPAFGLTIFNTDSNKIMLYTGAWASIGAGGGGGGTGITTLTGDVTASGTGSVTATITSNAVTDSKIRQSSGLSVIGRTANSTGDVSDIIAGTSGHVLRRSGTTLGFGTIDSVSVPSVHSEAYYNTKYAAVGSGMVYPVGGGIAIYNGAGGWGTSIADNSTNWNSAYTDRLKWDGGATGLVAATGRTSLGLVIGTDVQAYNSNLAAIAGLSPSNDDFIQRKAGVWTNRTVAQVKADLNIGQQIKDSLDVLGKLQIQSTVGIPMASPRSNDVMIRSIIPGSGMSVVAQGDSAAVVSLSAPVSISNGGTGYTTYDTVTYSVWNVGANLPTDTAAFSTSGVYGGFWNNSNDTIIVVGLRAVLQGTSPSINYKMWYNDSVNVTAGATAIINAGTTVTNTATGALVTSFDNNKIPPGVYVWVTMPTVTTKPTMFSLSLLAYRKRNY